MAAREIASRILLLPIGRDKQAAFSIPTDFRCLVYLSSNRSSKLEDKFTLGIQAAHLATFVLLVVLHFGGSQLVAPLLVPRWLLNVAHSFVLN